MSTVNQNSETNETNKKSVTPEVTASLCEDYKSGQFTQAELATKFGLSKPTVSNVLKAAGVKPQKRKYTHQTNKFVERNAEVVSKWQAGASTRELATLFGVTHQNISLIISKAGFAPSAAHKERLAVKSQARQERLAAEKATRTAAKMEKVNRLSELWKGGSSIEDIRAAAGLASVGAASVKIVLLRRKYGVEMFPKRQPFGRTATQTAEAEGEMLAKVQKLSEAWKGGKTPAECAAEVGWTVSTFSRTLPHLRKKHGVDTFPYRRQPKAKGEGESQEIPEFTAPQ